MQGCGDVWKKDMMRRLRVAYFVLGGVAVVGGGLALGAAALVGADVPPNVERAWLLVLIGLVGGGGLLAAASFVRGTGVAPVHAVATPSMAAPTAAEEPYNMREAAAALQQMRTYVGLESWELALAKAEDLVSRFPGTAEADKASRLLPDLRWKTEPKPVPSSSPRPQASARVNREEVGKLIQHARTYLDLEMPAPAGEKARKAAALDPENVEVMHLLAEIAKRGAPAAPPAEAQR